MGGLLVVEPLPLGIGKQSHQLIHLVFGRAHQELAGLDADQLDPNRVCPSSLGCGEGGWGFCDWRRGLGRFDVGRWMMPVWSRPAASLGGGSGNDQRRFLTALFVR